MEFLSLLTPLIILLVFAGVVIGVIFGSIPGLTATMAVAVCLPLTYSLGMNAALALLLGLYVGGIAGGMIPACLLNIPGTPSSICTAFDGYPMAQKGEGEKALKIGILASLFGGLFSAAALFFLAPVLADFAIKFSYVELFLIIFLALTVIGSLAKSILMGLFSGVLGIWLSLIGVYPVTEGGNGKTRLMFDFMQEYMITGFDLLPVLIGLFGLAIIFIDAAEGPNGAGTSRMIRLKKGDPFSLSVFKGKLTNLIRSSGIGTFVGMLPGVGGSTCSILAYTQEKNLSRDSSQMGKGAPQGVVASESSNNALTGGALVPLLSLGIPGDSTTAILIGAFTLQGIQVGPLFINANLDTWYLIVAILVIANFMMFGAMYFGIKYFAKVVEVPKHLLYPVITLMCVAGAYAIHYGVMFDVWVLLGFGLFGFIAHKVGIEIVPLIIGFILGRQAEVYFVKSLEAYGNLTIFFTKSPIAVVLWVLIAISIALPIYLRIRERRSSQVG